jgi:exopolysaccharide biosynthesis protein
MKFREEIIEKSESIVLTKIVGEIFDGKKLPFEGYLLKFDISKFKLTVFYTPHPQKTSVIVHAQSALAGINGGFWDEDKKPLDWCIINGKIITKFTNPNRPCIVVNDGVPKIYNCQETENLHNNYDKNSNLDLLQTGPLLLNNGKIISDFSEYQTNANEFDSDITIDRHPRSIFGLGKNHAYFVTINGRSRKSAGLYLEECAELAQKLGMESAINLDGGASSTLIYQEKLINCPRFSFIKGSRFLSARVPGRERKIPNALLIFPKK